MTDSDIQVGNVDVSTGWRPYWIFKATLITRSAVYHKAKLFFHCTQCVLVITPALYLHFTYTPAKTQHIAS